VNPGREFRGSVEGSDGDEIENGWRAAEPRRLAAQAEWRGRKFERDGRRIEGLSCRAWFVNADKEYYVK